MDYYTEASVVVEMSEDEADLIIAAHASAQAGNPDPQVFAGWDTDELAGAADAMRVEPSHGREGVWFSSSDRRFSNDYAAALISAHLKRAGSDAVVSWTYANTASRPTEDAFGGGAVAVSARGWGVEDASAAQNRLENRLRAEARAADIIARRAPDGDAEGLREALGLDDKTHDLFAGRAADLNGQTVEEVLTALVEGGTDPEKG